MIGAQRMVQHLQRLDCAGLIPSYALVDDRGKNDCCNHRQNRNGCSRQKDADEDPYRLCAVLGGRRRRGEWRRKGAGTHWRKCAHILASASAGAVLIPPWL